jgi:hypothetical protein
MPSPRPSRCAFALAVLLSGLASAVHAQSTNTPAASPAETTPWGARLWTTAREDWGFDHSGTLQLSSLGLQLSDRMNALIPDRWAPAAAIHSTEARLDLKAAPTEWLDLGVDPRLRWAASQYAGGHFESADEAYLGGWLVQARPSDDTRLAWSRQNLQWGPSYLTSPSNPFGGENGKNVPSVELPSVTYLKAAWLPTDMWSVSALANVAGPHTAEVPSIPGLNLPSSLELLSAWRSPGEGFKPTYALKNDFTFNRRTFSVIVSQRETDDPRVGAFGSWNVSDSVILYAEGSSDGQSDHDLLAGATYTFLDGSFMALEYYFNEGNAPDASSGVLGGMSSTTSVSGGFTSRNYLLVQYATTELIDRTTLAARWIVNLDQRCHRLALQANYDLGDRASLFANAVVDIGDDTDEYGATFQALATAGLNLLF